MESYSKFEKQLTAFENMIKSIMQVKFQEDFYLNILGEKFIPKIPQKFSKDFSHQTSIISIELLRELLIQISKRFNITNRDEKFIKNLTLFLKQFQLAKTLKKYFDDNIYFPVYLNCFNPVNNSRSNNIFSDTNETFFLTEVQLDFHKKIECENKIMRTKNEMFLLNERWNRILNENNNEICHFEKMTTENMHPYQEKLVLIQYILSDLYLKSITFLELIREWIFNYRYLQNNKPLIIDLNEYWENIIKSINSMKYKIQNIDDDIKISENLIFSMQNECDLFKLKEISILKSINKKQDLIKIRDSLNMDYESKLEKRSKLINELKISVSGTSKYNTISKEIAILEDLINAKFKDLKILNYSVFLAEEDSLNLATTLKDYIRWADSSEQILNVKKKDLVQKYSNKKYNELNLENIYENVSKIKNALGENFDISRLFHDKVSNDGRIISSTTYTIDKKGGQSKRKNQIDVN